MPPRMDRTSIFSKLLLDPLMLDILNKHGDDWYEQVLDFARVRPGLWRQVKPFFFVANNTSHALGLAPASIKSTAFLSRRLQLLPGPAGEGGPQLPIAAADHHQLLRLKPVDVHLRCKVPTERLTKRFVGKPVQAASAHGSPELQKVPALPVAGPKAAPWMRAAPLKMFGCSRRKAEEG